MINHTFSKNRDTVLPKSFTPISDTYLRLKNNYRIRHRIGKDMTYVIGANCKDGITLVGDKKITIDGGADFTFGNKIFSPLNTVVIGSSGYSGMYKTFQSRMMIGVKQIQKEIDDGTRPKNVTSDELIVLAEQIIHGLGNEYGTELMSNNFDSLMAIRVNIFNPELIRMTGIGLPEPVVEYKVVGHGEPYGSVILKNLWDKKITMEQFAKLSCFVITYIQKTRLDNSVGFDLELNEVPQVWYIPRVLFDPDEKYTQEQVDGFWEENPIKELSKDDVKKLMIGFDNSINEITNSIKKFKF